MKKVLLLSLTLTSFNIFAMDLHEAYDNACDPLDQDCSDVERVSDPNKSIYPFRPLTSEQIESKMSAIFEGQAYVSNLFEMEQRGLKKANTRIQPWGGSYWPLYQGMVGNTYQDKDYRTYIRTPGVFLSWEKNMRDFKKRAQEVYPRIYDLSEKELAKLAPSEKYDLLLGDTSFDLTKRIWNYAETWGYEKRFGFLSAIDLPPGYKVAGTNEGIQSWEGICHGWSVAAGHSPRPEKTVYVTLPNGKRMPFYPNDMKALLSLMWASSTIQSNVIFEGGRCNMKKPVKDKYGRYIDTEKDRDDSSISPRCADVHPGVFHLAMVNVLGIEGRSFVVDKTAEAAVANQPVSGYEFSYFNPKTGRHGSLEKSLITREKYGKNDPFASSRNPDSTYIIGVQVKLKYTDWENPLKKVTNTAKDDKIKDFKFNYDLELDSSGKIVGGQWRVEKDGSELTEETKSLTTHQPDFFWVVPRDWKNYFQKLPNLPEWNFAQSTLPPREYAPAARGAHSFVFEESERYFGYSPMCPAFPVGDPQGKPIMVKCEFKFPKPQPLINVIDKLVEESRK